MLVKVYDGTRMQSAERLCASCRHSHIVRGRREAEELIVCNAMALRSIRITFLVTECTDYIDVREPSFHELFEKAWVLRPATRRRPAGFVRGIELREAEIAKLAQEEDE